MTLAPLLCADNVGLNQAVEILRAGGVVVYPTETLYGLGGLAERAEVVRRIVLIKGRPADKPLPVVVADEEMAAEVAELTGPAAELAKVFWPGPLTLVLKARRAFPEAVARQGKLALRASSHPVAQALCRRLGRPLISTSANLSGRPGMTLARQVQEALAANPPDLILAGDPCPGGPGSTILDLTVSPPVLLREGAVAARELERFIQGWA